MKKKDVDNLKSKTVEDLTKMVFDKKLKLGSTKADIISSREKNLKMMKNLRRDISQILTVIRQKEIVRKLEV